MLCGFHFPRAEFQSERKHEKDYAELTDSDDGLTVLEKRNVQRMGTKKNSGKKIADDLRDLQFRENDRHYSHGCRKNCEILKKSAFLHVENYINLSVEQSGEKKKSVKNHGFLLSKPAKPTQDAESAIFSFSAMPRAISPVISFNAAVFATSTAW